LAFANSHDRSSANKGGIGGIRARTGIKAVQSLNNLTSITQNYATLGLGNPEEMTRVVSERTICYCSNFDLDAAEWFRLYQQLKDFIADLNNKLGKQN